MITTAVIKVLLLFVDMLLNLLRIIPFWVPIELPAPIRVTVPLPGLADSSVRPDHLQTWFQCTVGSGLALTIGAILQWIYRLIPFNG